MPRNSLIFACSRAVAAMIRDAVSSVTPGGNSTNPTSATRPRPGAFSRSKYRTVAPMLPRHPCVLRDHPRSFTASRTSANVRPTSSIAPMSGPVPAAGVGVPDRLVQQRADAPDLVPERGHRIELGARLGAGRGLRGNRQHLGADVARNRRVAPPRRRRRRRRRAGGRRRRPRPRRLLSVGHPASGRPLDQRELLRSEPDLYRQRPPRTPRRFPEIVRGGLPTP